MLPDRSKRYAGVDGDIARLVLANPWQLVLIALLVLALLTAIFPRKALVERLYAQKSLDELTLSYVQNLYRANPANADAALLLARSQQASMTLADMERILWPLVPDGEPRQRIEARSLLFHAYQNHLGKNPNPAEKTRLNGRLVELLLASRQEALPEELLHTFASKAFELNLPRVGMAFYQQLQIGEPGKVFEKYGDIALSEGQYAAAANYYFLARESASSVDESRRLFLAGVQTLMAASLFEQAMSQARERIGTLADDAPTLRFLSRAALAAGDAKLAADYARRLVFRNQIGSP